MFTGFIIHFYITFGTNLLTGSPAHIVVLLPISVFRRKGISDGVQTEWNLRQRDFLEEYDLGDLEFTSEDPRGGQEIGGRAHPSWARPYLLDTSRIFWLDLQFSWMIIFQKIRCRRFHSVWTPFDIPFLRNTETSNKTTIWDGPPINRLVPKVI